MDSLVNPRESLRATRLSGRFYRPELDVLRFVAFLMVYLTHTIQVVPGSPHWVIALSNATGFGVPIFFALSAYLITELLMIEKRRSGTVDLPAFYVRRCLRIWPLYFLLLFLGFALSRASSEEIPVSALLAYLFFVGNWYTSFHDFLPHAIGPLWSIPVEEQFYLFWPIFVRSLSRRGLGVLCCAGWTLSQATLIALCHWHNIAEPKIWTNSIVHLQYFALGAGVSLYLDGAIPRIHGSLRSVMIGAALVILFMSDFALNQNTPDPPASFAQGYLELLFAGLATALLLFGFLGYGGLQKRTTLRYLGKISFGLYLFHIPCFTFLRKLAPHLLGHGSPLFSAVVGLPLTIGVAAVSYRYFESPFLRMKERFTVVQSRGI